MTLPDEIIAAVQAHPALRDIRLVGSRAESRSSALSTRAEGRATAFSDWDFALDTSDLSSLGEALPQLLAPLSPLSQQWDRLSEQFCWMVMLRGPMKVDLIFVNEPHVDEPPWNPAPDNLQGIDAHLWDWMLWLRSKKAKGQDELVATELSKLFVHLLAPLGVVVVPASIEEAVNLYRGARDRAESRFAQRVTRELEAEVAPALAGF